MSVDGHSSRMDGVRSVDRAFNALELLVEAAPHTVRVVDVAARIGADPATASRLLATLTNRGYASRTPQRRYTVGPRSLRMASGWVERLQVASAGPMERMSRATGEVVMLTQLLGTHAVPIASRVPPGRGVDSLPAFDDGIPGDGGMGAAYPVWATAAGRALLAALPPVERRRALPLEPYPSFTARTPTNWPDLRDLVRTGVRDGMHFEQGEAVAGLWCYALPLPRGTQGEVLSLSVLATGDLNPSRHARILRALRAESRTLGDHIALVPTP
ncbi:MULTISPECIES: IclR family transcriptional regulator [Pseudofrankia]|uniref:IclR family transcriptional regulator n=1 Tax=Pseudofrankia TaxID=2994363 RepID=UPI000486A501|nr:MULTISPECIES: IclR family transcriptional regulator C-terminal domain-containing protein [Pseudofrankia]OHV36555.1 hypothetical protein BCD49_18490 [Pseudofrankia sp. EUN1h]